ncbi:hypothetical protein [Nocardioides sp. CER19]|uniref:hypothetical protein n=1 Tax=Nocardioides sp. CER19 TaxID=3038538 RepID=UPI002449D624|nr:hypothetical protein [Nocardioides sp. CER19]MDH2412974.1 hypothetical protein [Nocardioides sp. CER19]
MTNRPHPLDQVEFRFGIGAGGLVLAVIVARLAGLDEAHAAVLLLGVTAALGATVSRALAALLGLTAWALLTGFVTHRYGVLTFALSDLLLMTALLAGALGGSSVATHAVRHHRTPHRSTYGRTA